MRYDAIHLSHRDANPQNRSTSFPQKTYISNLLETIAMNVILTLKGGIEFFDRIQN